MPDNLFTIRGLAALQALTEGDPRIVVAVLDGPVDLDRACFRGANVTKIAPYWQQEVDTHPKHLELFLEIEDSDDDDETKSKRLRAVIPDSSVRNRLYYAFHATHISSTIFGQPGSPVRGIAPRCTGINIPIDLTGEIGEFISPLNLARALNLGLEMGANIIHCAACHPTQTGVSHELIERAVRECQENNVLVVAPGGNDKGECWCIPAGLPGVLSIGAMKDNGQPFKFSNWGGNYQSEGVLAPGENILGAQPGTDVPRRKNGTSCAAPIVTGVSALLVSLQLQQGMPIDPEGVRTAILNSSIPCEPDEVEELGCCLRGRLDIPGAVQVLFGQPFMKVSKTYSREESSEDNSASQQLATIAAVGVLPEPPTSHSAFNLKTANQPTDAVIASAALSKPVYAIGTLGYDFGTEARRDSFKQLMPAGEAGSANPHDTRQMVDYLEKTPTEAEALIWTLNLESSPIYVIEPAGPFAADVYDVVQVMLGGQVEPGDSEDYIESVSVPGWLTDRTVRLFSGQVVPVMEVESTRGMYGWNVNALVNAALQTLRAELTKVSEYAIRYSLSTFLNRIYYDLHNLGRTSRHRALNFAATNAFQAVTTFSETVATGLELDRIEVEKSPFCRLGSDCWDVKLTFFDPENGHRARKVYRFTIDVSDSIPVTLGIVRSWSVSS